MTEEDDIDGLAAEYVLGSLPAAEREMVDARLYHEGALREAVAAWERRLAPLSDRLAGIAPPPQLRALILGRIAQASRPIAVISPPATRRRRATVAGISALAACLLLVAGWMAFVRTGSPTMLVAQLHRMTGQDTADESDLPAFAVSIDISTRIVTVRPITVRPVSGRNYAAWLAQPGGGTPMLLGTVSSSQPTVLPWPTTRPPGDFVNAKLTISIHDEGSPPTWPPTGPFRFIGILVGADKSRL